VRGRLTSAVLLVLATCIGVRVASAILTPIIPGLLALCFVGGVLLWVLGRR